jgi:hypothetical protein
LDINLIQYRLASALTPADIVWPYSAEVEPLSAWAHKGSYKRYRQINWTASFAHRGLTASDYELTQEFDGMDYDFMRCALAPVSGPDTVRFHWDLESICPQENGSDVFAYDIDQLVFPVINNLPVGSYPLPKGRSIPFLQVNVPEWILDRNLLQVVKDSLEAGSALQLQRDVLDGWVDGESFATLELVELPF